MIKPIYAVLTVCNINLSKELNWTELFWPLFTLFFSLIQGEHNFILYHHCTIIYSVHKENVQIKYRSWLSLLSMYMCKRTTYYNGCPWCKWWHAEVWVHDNFNLIAQGNCSSQTSKNHPCETSLVTNKSQP